MVAVERAGPIFDALKWKHLFLSESVADCLSGADDSMFLNYATPLIRVPNQNVPG